MSRLVSEHYKRIVCHYNETGICWKRSCEYSTTAFKTQGNV